VEADLVAQLHCATHAGSSATEYNQKACNCESTATQRPPNVVPVVLVYYQHFLDFLGFLFENVVFWSVMGSST